MTKSDTTPPVVRNPTPAQQSVLDRIQVQRDRLRERRAQRAQMQAVVQAEQGVPPNASMALRAADFAKQHPMAVAALAGVALIAGPKRLMRWAGVALPLVMRLRTHR
ncbi:MAG: hypothetical protein PHU77_08650 [Simplicispira sp.]|nr:hypothetical protein [Simplicispira sp.]